MNISELHQLFLQSSGVCTDTRKIFTGCIFFALKGENFNANNFATEALTKGAAYAVVDEEPKVANEQLILVNDVLKSLQKLATFHRCWLNIPIIALTGSNGKTTTKELINAALQKKYKTTATRGNLNNHIGVPLTLLSMNSSTEIGVVEMGANHLEEIKFLSQLAQPDYGYITNFGKAHLEGFGSVEGVIKGKSELYEYLKANGKTLFLNYDDPLQKQQISYSNAFSFGEDLAANLSIEYAQHGPYAALQVEGKIISSKLSGIYNAKNMAAAYAIATYFKVPLKDIKHALENYIPANNRSQIITLKGIEVILDAYNANPTSMALAIENLEQIQKSPKTVILGDMFEMGAMAQKEHQQLVNKLQDSSIDNVYLIGDNFYETTAHTRIKKFKNFDYFAAGFDPGKIANNIVLIKGSRGMALERVLDLL